MILTPNYLLYCDSRLSIPADAYDPGDNLTGTGHWHFVLKRTDDSERLEAIDSEPNIHRDRIALLSVVRGLEALEQSGQVQLVTTSRYVDRGLRFGLPNWRETNYQWENFGLLRPVKNADLWHRIDCAMQYHQVACRFQKGKLEFAEALAESQFGDQVQKVSGPMGKRQFDPASYGVNRLAPNRGNGELPNQGHRRQWWEMAASWIQAINQTSGPVAACGT